MDDARPSLAMLFEAGKKLIDAYIERTAGLKHDEKGIRPSEGFFIFAALAGNPPRRILESGRARGFSTSILAHCFPGTAIISIESDADSGDVQIAAQRLAGLTNVDCRFGDARALLPQLLEHGDIVLIDGPKDFRALKVALWLLQTGKTPAVFLHDLSLGIPVRRFLEAKLPSAFFSDEPQFVREYGFLDTGEARPPLSWPEREAPRQNYGAAMGCIPVEKRNYKLLLLQLTLLQWKHRLQDSGRKMFGRKRE